MLSRFTPHAIRASWLKLTLVVASMAVVLAITSPALAEMPGPTAPGNAPQYSVPNPYQKPDKAQNPAWILMKNHHQITRPGFHAIANAFPSYAELSTSVVSTTLEPSAQYQITLFGQW